MLRGASFLGLALVFGCTPVQLEPLPAPDAGNTVLPRPDAGVTLPKPWTFHEDFSSPESIDTSSVAIVDLNSGTVSLPSRAFRELPVNADGVATLTQYAGAVRASSIVVSSASVLEGSDSVDLRATRTIRITGRIHAGAGGVAISAGEEIFIDGSIESDGPVYLEVSSEDGRIEVNGRIQTLDAADRSSGNIGLTTRGRIKIAGALGTGAGGATSGDIALQSYGPVELVGPGAVIVPGASSAGHSGSVSINTEATITIDGAIVHGGEADLTGNARSTSGGDVILHGASVRVLERAEIAAGPALDGTAGRVEVVSEGALLLQSYAKILGGAGRLGGRVSIDARTATIAGVIGGGDGIDAPGWAVIGTAGPLWLDTGAQIAAGGGVCAQGGDTVLLIAGRLTVGQDPITISGGVGGTGEQSAHCAGMYPGGNVSITAQDFVGSFDNVIRPGSGRPAGAIALHPTPSFTRPLPDIHVRVEGWVISRAIDKGAFRGQLPVLADLSADMPAGTFVVVELAAADEEATEPLTWHAISVGSSEEVEALRDAKSIRYRLYLKGRALDVPTVDYFDLSLGPL
ncbi:MAG: hypothetical protein U1E65_35365 [Myxococcota bacterium]